jgi:hypothetical protein
MLWAENHNKQYPFQVSVAQGGTKEFVEAGPVSLQFSAISNEVGTFTVLACSSDKGRVPRKGIANLTDLNVSYFLNPGVRPDMPEGVLAGDRNFTGGVARASNVVEFTAQSSPGWGKGLHGPNGGYVALADGSVHETTTRNFRDLLPGAPGGTSRLIFPVGELPTSIVHQRLASKTLSVLGAVAICGALVALVWFSLREPVKREV